MRPDRHRALATKRHYGEIRRGVPDEAQRTELIKQFMARTLKPEGVPR